MFKRVGVFLNRNLNWVHQISNDIASWNTLFENPFLAVVYIFFKSKVIHNFS